MLALLYLLDRRNLFGDFKTGKLETHGWHRDNFDSTNTLLARVLLRSLLHDVSLRRSEEYRVWFTHRDRLNSGDRASPPRRPGRHWVLMDRYFIHATGGYQQSSGIRKQAVFWLGKSHDSRALDYLTRAHPKRTEAVDRLN